MEYTLHSGYVIPSYWNKISLRGIPDHCVISLFKEEKQKGESMSKDRLLELKKVYEDQLKEKKEKFDGSIRYYVRQLEEYVTLCKEMDELDYKIRRLELDSERLNFQ